MYTRCPSIASVCQKTVSLKYIKCNKIIYRQLHSESLVRFSKIESKLKPMKRCFSGAATVRNSMQKTRIIQGVGVTRKTFEQQPLSQSLCRQMAQNNAEQSQNCRTQTSGKITIVIDKNDIFNCSSPNEDVEIHVSTAPATQTKRSLETLPEVEVAKNCSIKCTCCQRCEEARKSRNQTVLPLTANQNTLQQPNNGVNFPIGYPRLGPNFYGIPLRNFSMFDDSRSVKTEMSNLKRNRSMSDFPTMRKMVVPEGFNRIQPNIGPVKMQLTPPTARSQSNVNYSGNFNQPSTLQRTIPPNILMERRVPFQSHSAQNLVPNQIRLPQQQAREFGTVERNAKRMQEELNRQRFLHRRYSSFHQNVVPTNIPTNKPDLKQNKRPQNDTEIGGRSGPKLDKQPQQPQNLSIPVLRPATFSSSDSNRINNKNFKLTSVPNQILFNQQQTTIKNKFPEQRAGVPRMLAFPSQKALSPVQRGNMENVPKNFSHVGLRSRFSSPLETRANVIPRNNSAAPVPLNFYGKPFANFSMIDGGRSENILNLKRSRSMSDFPGMRKMIVPEGLNRMHPNLEQLPINMQRTQPVYRTRSLSNLNYSGNFNNNQPATLQRTIAPNMLQMERRVTYHSHPAQNVIPNQIRLPQQQAREFSTVERNAKRMEEELNRQRFLHRRYSSFHQNVVPTNTPTNKPDLKQNKRTQNDTEIGGRSGPEMKKQPPQQSHHSQLSIPVLRPATFSSIDNNIASSLKEIATNQKVRLTSVSNQKQKSAEFFQGHVDRKLNLFNQQQTTTKNKFPEGRVAVPRMFTFQSQNSLNSRPSENATNLVQCSNRDNLSKRYSDGAPRTSFIAAARPNNVFCQQNSNKLPSNAERPMPMPARHMNNLCHMKQPPQVFLKKRMLLRPAMNSQPLQGQENSFIPVPQQPNLPQKEQPQFTPNLRNATTPMQASMIPVRNNISAQLPPQNNFPQQNRSRADSMRKIPPVLPLESLLRSNQTEGIRDPKLNAANNLQAKEMRDRQVNVNNVTDATKQNKLQKRSDIRRMNEEKLRPSFVPVNVTNQPNQIEKYVERPKSLQAVRQPPSNQANINQSRVPDKNLRLQQMSQVPRTSPVNVQQSLSRKRPTTQPDKMKESSPNPAAITPKTTNNSNLKYNNPAVLFYAPGHLKLVNIPVPRLADDKGVIVKMLYVHLTDTDTQMLSSIQDGPYKLTKPTIAGKSGSGLIIDTGKEVDNVKVGDKVSVKGMSCGKCTACENDNEVICERVPTTEKLGILKRFHSVPAKFVTKLPDAVHPIDGAMIDELSSAIRACKKSTVTAGDNVLVLGGKSLGLWTALAAKSMGATDVCLADSRPAMLEQARKLGIDRVFLIKPDSPISTICNSISENMKGDNPRVVFDCNGSPLTNQIAINTSKIGGKVVLMKNVISNQPIVLSDAVDRGIDILSSQHGNNDSERAALQFLASGKVKLNGIDSSFFNISNVHEAFAVLASGTNSNIFIQPSRPDDENNEKTTKKTS